MEQCNDVLEFKFQDGTLVYYVVCQRKPGHRGRHFDKTTVKRKNETIDYSVYWRKVRDK